ncbi:hypothetical protein I4907_02765 [Proteus mirabilis]|nr:hypothetical protein [Proteus mirabilis]
MSFQDLSSESQQIARETLAEILKLEREHAYDLSDGQSKDIAKFVKDAFIELEKENILNSKELSVNNQNINLTNNPKQLIGTFYGGIGSFTGNI